MPNNNIFLKLKIIITLYYYTDKLKPVGDLIIFHYAMSVPLLSVVIKMGRVGCELLSTQISGPDIAFHWSESVGMRGRFD